jgi:molybdopterin molybdotransferase
MNTRAQPGLLAFVDARRAVEREARALRPAEAELVALLEARGRVLAEPIVADRDFPPFPRATRDGYAVRAADVADPPAKLRVAGEIRAGRSWERATPLAAGEAVAIMTGAPAPAGADAVVMVEYTRAAGDVVEILRGVLPGENIVPTGAEARAGAQLLAPGTRIAHAQIALAAAVGRTGLRVHRRPRVAILSTGDEVVDIAAEPGPNQVRNSNAYSLAAQVAAAGGLPVPLPIAPDDPDPLRRLLQLGIASELLLITGGVSVGKYDLVEAALEQLGAEFIFTGAAIQPGRPAVFGRVPPRAGAQPIPFFGLPGNPVSTMVTFELFARPVLEALAGAAPVPLRFVQARLRSEFKTKAGLTRFLPAMLTGEFEQVEVDVVKWQGSGDMAATARADCYLVVPPDRDVLRAGDTVSILLVQT